MVFLFILLVIILAIVTTKVKVDIVNIKFISNLKEHINKDYKIKIAICIFQKIPVLIMNIDNKKIVNNRRINKIVKDNNGKIEINERYLNTEIFEIIKSLKIELNEMDLKILIGTENAGMTAFIIPIVSTFLAMFLSKKISRYNNKQIFSVTPVYINENLINIEFSGIFQIQMIHIINTICIFNKKKRKGDKNERTSNRRAYDYSYE